MTHGQALSCMLCGSGSATLVFRLRSINILRCVHCQLTFSDLPTADLAALYAEDYYRQRQEYYFGNSVVDPAEGVETDTIVDFRRGLQLIESLKAPGRLLDLGCGTGIFLAMARQSGWDVHGVDISEYAIAFARERFGVPGFAGGLREAGFAPGSFDVVTLWDAVEHFPDPVQQLQEVRRIVKDDGIVVLNTPNADSPMRSLARLAYRLTGGWLRYPAAKLYHEYHLYYFSADTLTRLLAKAGFRPVQLTKKPIPITKARGRRMEKLAVRALSLLERMTGEHYEILAVARRSGEGP